MTEHTLPEESIFLQALEIESVAERAAYLERACGANGPLRSGVEALLRAHRNSGDLLDLPDAPALAKTVEQAAEARPVCEGPGSQIGPYKLLEQIGEGGFGVVFMAEQTRPVKRKVALKILKPGMDTRQVIARFEAERQALALMDHPNIAKVFDGGTTGESKDEGGRMKDEAAGDVASSSFRLHPASFSSGRPYFVMELVRGIAITEYCDQHQLTPRERLELFVTVCQAVQHAHQKGIIHRDIKPSNVLVAQHDDKPVVKIIDFGIAKATIGQLTDKTLFTGFAQMIGTPLYMSPEQAALSGLDIDTRSDIYSLGVLLYELLTGTTPFDKERLKAAAYDEIRRIIREEEPQKPSTRLSGLSRFGTPSRTSEREVAAGRISSARQVGPTSLASISAVRRIEPHRLTQLLRGDLDWIVMKSLEKDRTRRYATANGLAADVQRYLDDEPVEACPPSAWYQFRKFARRNRAALGMGGVIVGSLLTSVVALSVSNWQVNVKQLQTLEALEQTKVEKRERMEQLWEAMIARARANQLSRHPGQRFETLEILERANDLARNLDLPDEKLHELRSAVIAALSLPDMHLAGPGHPLPADTSRLAFDGAHSRYARSDLRGNCSIRRVADDAEIHRFSNVSDTLPNLSRDGRFLGLLQYTNHERTAGLAAKLWDLRPEAARLIFSKDNARSVDFHPDGEQAAVVYNDGAIGLFELPSGRQLAHLPPIELIHQVTIALHPVEPLVAICSYFESIVQLRDLSTGEVVASLPQAASPNALAWAPDGRTLAVALAEPRQIRLYDRQTLGPVRTLESSQAVDFLAFNHAGDRLTSNGWAKSAELFDIGTGHKLFSATHRWSRQWFSRDDQHLAGTIDRGRLGIWQVADGREYRMLRRQGAPKEFAYQSLSVSPDGRLLAVGTTDGFGLWDLADGNELNFIKTPEADNWVHFESSGNLLALCGTGLDRWPIRAESGLADQYVMGPPEPLPLPRGSAVGQSRDGRVIVTCSRTTDIELANSGGWILHTDRPDPPIRIDEGADVVYIAVSPDGRWVVTVTHNPEGLARVWDARDGKLITELGNWRTGRPQFSPDGKWLSTELDGGRLFSVGDWKPGLRMGGAGTFSSDGKLLAVATAGSPIRLVDRATGRELAVLEDPQQRRSSMPTFTPDGTKLIAYSGGELHGIRVLDLRLIRRRLDELGLDWSAPPYPPADPASTLVPLRVEVRLPEPARPTLSLEEKARQEIEEYRLALGKDPNCVMSCNGLAWTYLTAPEPLCDVKAALPLAKRAVQLAPGNAFFANTLGLAYCRNGRFGEAIAILRLNLTRQDNQNLAFDLFMLAMSYQGLGETVQARDYFDLAVRWMETQTGLPPKPVQELHIFRNEAERMLGIEKIGNGRHGSE